jgi:hypothetical protein
MDNVGYPEKEDLDQLKNLTGEDILSDFNTILSLFEATKYGSGIVRNELVCGELALQLHTGGWSGCEDMIEVLMENILFWSRFWYSSTRGGHYEFRG